MNPNIPYIIAGVAVCLLAYSKISQAVRGWLAKRDQDRTDLKALTKALQDVDEDLIGIRQALQESKLIPEMLKSQGKALEAIVAEVAKFREQVKQFTSMILKPEEGEDVKVYEEYDEQKAERIMAKQQYMSQGFTPEEAEHRVEADEAARVYTENPAL